LKLRYIPEAAKSTSGIFYFGSDGLASSRPEQARLSLSFSDVFWVRTEIFINVFYKLQININ
jgi:hypothetical protein